MRRRSITLGLRLAAVVVLGAGGLSAAPAAAQEIKIGALLSVTGPAAFLGDPELKTLQLFVERINAAGGILNRRIALVTVDDAADPAKAASFAKRLIEVDKVDLIIGSSTTGTTMAVVPIVERAGMPLISLAGGAPITTPVKKWVFKTPGTDTHSVEKIYEDLRDRKLTKIALLAETTGVGQSSKQEAQKLAGKYGISIEADESFGSRDADVTPQLTRLRDNPAVQAIIVTGFGQGPAVATRNYAQINVGKPMYHTHGVASQEFVALTGKASEGVRMSAPAQLVAADLSDKDPQKPVLLAYRKEYALRYKEDPSTFGGYAHDALMIAVAAIKRAGSTDKEKVREAIEQTRNFVGTAGVVNMSPTDHVGLDLSSFKLIEIRDGRFKLIR